MRRCLGGGFTRRRLTICLAAEALKQTWTFDADPVGEPPGDFKTEVGTWTVMAVDGGRCLVQSAKSEKPMFNLVLVNAPPGPGGRS